MTQPLSSIIQAAQAAQIKWGIPASISIAQYAEESGWGKHDLGCFNFFGIKSLPGQPCVVVPTQEQDKYGRVHTINAGFRKFDSPTDAFMAHAQLLAKAPVYAAAMKHLPDVQAFVFAMAPHYATDVNYATKLMALIKGDRLTQYDKAV